MYPFLLALHSWLRWAVVLFGVGSVTSALVGVLQKQPFGPGAQRLSRGLCVAMDTQLTLGLLLYCGVSPLTQVAFSHWGLAMHDPGLRFFAVEHTAAMLLTWGLVHAGKAKLRRVPPPLQQRTALLFYGLAMLILLASIPWPFARIARPWIRGF